MVKIQNIKTEKIYTVTNEQAFDIKDNYLTRGKFIFLEKIKAEIPDELKQRTQKPKPKAKPKAKIEKEDKKAEEETVINNTSVIEIPIIEEQQIQEDSSDN